MHPYNEYVLTKLIFIVLYLYNAAIEKVIAMQIKPSAAIRNNYNEIASYCRETGEPVYLTKNGEGDLIVMDIKSYENQRRALEIEVELLKSRNERLQGAKIYTIAETLSMMDKVIENAGIKNG